MQLIERLKTEKVKKRFASIIIFGAWYLCSFFWMEQRSVHIHLIRMEIDKKIPFCEYFIIPYVLWYLFVAGTVVYLTVFGDDDKEYRRLIFSLGIGMILFLIISYVYPNGQNLRPKLRGDGIFIDMVRILYKIDTPTNILPSLHVFNSVACGIALLRNEKVNVHKWFCAVIVVLVVLIILSTMFLKQHSMLDVIVALMMNVVCYAVLYVKAEAKQTQRVWIGKEL